MIEIDHIDIKYFRSIYRLALKDLKDIVVLAGVNDIGKSNVLKALNLFFNSEAGWREPLNFDRDFSRRRLQEVRKETIKGKQFIQVGVGFVRGNRFEKSLPQRFTVTRTWHRYSTEGETTSSLPRQHRKGEVATTLDRAQAGLQRFLSSIRFEYIPAIKESDFFTYMLGRLQDLLIAKNAEESDVVGAVERLNTTLQREAAGLQSEFEAVVGIPTSVRLPEKIDQLFRAFTVATRKDDEDFPLSVRGDGIRSRFLPSLLYHISKHAKRRYIWGFEEPENSIEHRLCTALAKEMVTTYCREAQVLITSHSPAFFGLRDRNVCVYRVQQDVAGTCATCVHPDSAGSGKGQTGILNVEMGLMALQEEQQRQYEKMVAEMDAVRRASETVLGKLRSATSPVLLVEGKWDAAILREAWSRINSAKEPPYRIIPCGDSLQGGADTLRSSLETVLPDEPPTVGLFDHDKQGFECCFSKLNRTFEALGGTSIRLKSDGAAAAVVLEPPPDREDFATHNTLTIEFMFADRYLRTQKEGRTARLSPLKIAQVIEATSEKVSREDATDPSLVSFCNDDKAWFAGILVPSLPDEAFEPFRAVFDLIQRAFDEAKMRRAAAKLGPA